MSDERRATSGEDRRAVSSRLVPRALPSLPPAPCPLPPRRGLTLIELLVVIIILTTLVSAAIPILAPTNDDRRLREASRNVNAFITGAQMKAIETQRPYGVAIKRLSSDTNPGGGVHDDNAVSVELFYVEQPSPFVGFSDTSSARISLYEPANASRYGGLRPLVRIQFVARGNVNPQSNDGLPTGWDADVLPEATIRPGDVIEIAGTRYELLSDTNDNGAGGIPPEFDATGTFFTGDTGRTSPLKAPQIAARPINDTGQNLPVRHDDFGNVIGTVVGANPPFFTEPAPYKILRQPMPTSEDPLQLPDGTAIDLRASGVGSGLGTSATYFYYPQSTGNDPHPVINNSQGILIMFAPEGRVSHVSFSRAPGNMLPFDQPVVDNLYLLVGRRENAPPPPAANDPTLDPTAYTGTEQQLREMKEANNWLRSESRWVAIGALSGRVVTVENAFVEPRAVINKYVDPPNVTVRSEPLRTAQIHEARAFAREMTQVGGR